jgi:hypothetical protein
MRRTRELKIGQHRGHLDQADRLKSVRHRIAPTTGVHEESPIRLQVLDGKIEALLGLRRPA